MHLYVVRRGEPVAALKWPAALGYSAVAHDDALACLSAPPVCVCKVPSLVEMKFMKFVEEWIDY